MKIALSLLLSLGALNAQVVSMTDLKRMVDSKLNQLEAAEKVYDTHWASLIKESLRKDLEDSAYVAKNLYPMLQTIETGIKS
jgi:hypothetical protein